MLIRLDVTGLECLHCTVELMLLHHGVPGIGTVPNPICISWHAVATSAFILPASDAGRLGDSQWTPQSRKNAF
jgi:hypothetical protein